MLKNPLYLYSTEDRYVPARLNAGDFLLQNIWQHKDKICMINGATDEKLTYGEIAQETMNLALCLVKLGVKRGDVIAICSENRREFWSSVIGVLCAGGVVTTINTSYTKDELKHITGISKPKFVICSPFTYKAQAKTFKSIECIKNLIIYGDEIPKNTLSYNALAKVGGSNSMLKENVNIDEFDAIDVEGTDDLAMILYSSGTTGLPKGVMLTHLNVLTACSSTVETPTFVALTITPWYHTMGLMSHLIGFVKGFTSIYLPKFEVEQYLQTVEKYKVSHLSVVPPVLVALCKTPTKHDVSSVMIVRSGAAPLHKETAEAVFKRFPNAQAVLQGYGMTEATLAISLNTNPDKKASVGQINSNSIIKIVHPETGKVLGPNQEGEVCVKSVMIMKGYIGKKKQDDFDEEGFFKTGDIGYYDDDKYLYIVDRLKELIKYKAHQVAPAEIEAVLLKHKGVRDAGVVGMPHPSAGEVPVAFVVAQPDSKVTEAELQQFVAERLSNTKHLRGGVMFIDAIPKSATGKILRKDLKKMVKSSKSKL